MKNFINAVSAIFICLVCTFSCKKEKEAAPASVKIEITSTTASSVSFSIVSENASEVYYAVVKDGQDPVSSYEKAEGDLSLLEIEKTGLEENTEYQISAYALNQDGIKSDVTSVSAITGILPLVSIEVNSYTDTSVVFTVKPVNAVSFDYCVVKSDEAETSVPGIHIDGGEAREIEVDGLEQGTRYMVMASSVNADGVVSEIISKEFITEETPVLSVKDVYTDETSAIISVEYENASKMYYALTSKGDAEPSEEDFVKFSRNTIYLYDLEAGKEYTVWMYAENRKGYAGKVISVDFTAEAGEDRGFGAVIYDITAFDANVKVSWDSEKYSCAYWIVGSLADVGEPEDFNWEEGISLSTVKSISYQGNFRFSTFGVKSGELYRFGIVFADKEGNIDSSTSIWRDVQLDEIVFGVADCSAELEEISHSYNRLSYRIKNNGSAGYYFGYSLKDNVYEIEDYAKNVTKGTIRTDFDTDLLLQNLAVEKEYIVVVVPVDAEGNLGDYDYLEFKTDKIELKGNSSVEVNVSDVGYVDLTVDVAFGENTMQVAYFKSTVDKTDEDALLSCAMSSMKVNESGQIKISYLLSDSEVYLWFVSIDKDGNLGNLVKVEASTKKIEFNGTGSVNVSLDEIGEGDMYNCTFTLMPESNIVKYYYTSLSKNYMDSNTDIKISEYLMQVGKEADNVLTDTRQMFSPEYLVVLPVDKDGNLCNLIKRFVK